MNRVVVSPWDSIDDLSYCCNKIIIIIIIIIITVLLLLLLLLLLFLIYRLDICVKNLSLVPQYLCE